MIRLALRGLAARKRRGALTALAVLLGVAMVSGTFVVTDTIDRAFESLFKETNRGADAVISGRTAVDSNSGFTRPPPFDERVLQQLKGLSQVRTVAGQVDDFASVVGKDGKVVGTGGAPTIALSYVPPPFNATRIASGRPPRGPDEVALDERTADREGFAIGDRVTITSDRPARPFRLTGLVGFGQEGSIGGATIVVLTLPTAQELFLKRGKIDTAFVAGRPGVAPTQLVRAIDPLLPAGTQARTGGQQAQEDLSDIREGLSFLTGGLLAFGFIAVLVGAFIIFNTFSITVAQRTRELALLRTLGASRRQVLRSIMLEALIIGALASAAGIGAGFVFAAAVKAVFEGIGIGLPSTSPVLESRTVIVALLTGIVVTLAGAVMPALRATRVAPIEALREGVAVPPSRLHRWVPVLAGVVALAGVALVLAGLLSEGGSTTTKLITTAGGAVVLVFGVAFLTPRIVRPAARVLGGPLERMTILVGRLARENAGRSPGRTAVTAGALMVGLAIVLFVTILAAGFRASTEDLIGRRFAGDVAVLHDNGFSPIPAAAAAEVAKVPGVQTVSSISKAEARIPGIKGTASGSAVEPSTIASVYDFDWVDGSGAALGQLDPGGIVFEEDMAKAGDFDVGDRVAFTASTGRRAELTVRGIYSDNGFLTGYAIGKATFDRLFAERRVVLAIAGVRDGANLDRTIAAANRALDRFPEARARSQGELADEYTGQINQLLYMFYALLAMSVLISMFGIVNTLTLAIHERTRELGLMRAVGMTRRDVRRMIRYESVITACIGAALGLVLGLFFAIVVTLALSSEGVSLSIPVVQVVALMVFAACVGVVAAIPPARRASRLDVLGAIAHE